jgi:hypothetical protein
MLKEEGLRDVEDAFVDEEDREGDADAYRRRFGAAAKRVVEMVVDGREKFIGEVEEGNGLRCQGKRVSWRFLYRQERLSSRPPAVSTVSEPVSIDFEPSRRGEEGELRKDEDQLGEWKEG